MELKAPAPKKHSRSGGVTRRHAPGRCRGDVVLGSCEPVEVKAPAPKKHSHRGGVTRLTRLGAAGATSCWRRPPVAVGSGLLRRPPPPARAAAVPVLAPPCRLRQWVSPPRRPRCRRRGQGHPGRWGY